MTAERMLMVLGCIALSGCAQSFNIDLASFVKAGDTPRFHRIDDDLDRLKKSFWDWYGMDTGHSYLLPYIHALPVVEVRRYIIRVGGEHPSENDSILTIRIDGNDVLVDSKGMNSYLVSRIFLTNIQGTPQSSGDVITLRAELQDGQAIESRFRGKQFFRGTYFGLFDKGNSE